MSTLSEHLGIVRRQVVSIRARAASFRDKSAAGALNADDGREIVATVRAVLGQFATVPRTAATATMAVNEWGYSGLDIGADFTAIEAGLHAVGDWIAARADVMYAGFDMAPGLPWTETAPTFSATASAGLRTALDALIAACDTFLGCIEIG